jgi:hypothetical protein
MTFNEFIERELRLAQASKPFDALTARFVQLHRQAVRDKSEAAEYRKLYSAMRTRWRWQTATLDAQARRA